MTQTPDDVALNILANVIRAVGQRQWEGGLTPAQRALVRACCGEAGRLALRALATPGNRDLHLDLLRDKARIHARLADAVAPAGTTAGAVNSAGARRLADAFWDGFRDTVSRAVAVAYAEL